MYDQKSPNSSIKHQRSQKDIPKNGPNEASYKKVMFDLLLVETERAVVECIDLICCGKIAKIKTNNLCKR